MVKKQSLKQIEKIIKEYILLLKDDGFNIEKILLYGSYAKGEQKKIAILIFVLFQINLVKIQQKKENIYLENYG